MLHKYLILMDESGLVFDLTIMLIFVVVTLLCMKYAEYRNSQQYKDRISQRRYNYETVTREKDSENDRNTWF